jgi:hypothetical protein
VNVNRQRWLTYVMRGTPRLAPFVILAAWLAWSAARASASL